MTTPITSTAQCKQLLGERFPHLPPSGWKRLSKSAIGQTTYRKFAYGNVVVTIETDSQTGEVHVSTPRDIHREEQVASVSQVPLKPALIAAARSIKHCGDYGYLYYHLGTHHVWLALGDGDGGGDNGTTEVEECERLLSIPGVSQVTVEAEHDPDSSDPQWVFLGKVGKTITLY